MTTRRRRRIAGLAVAAAIASLALLVLVRRGPDPAPPSPGIAAFDVVPEDPGEPAPAADAEPAADLDASRKLAEVLLQDGPFLEGVVTDPAGAPVPGARVYADVPWRFGGHQGFTDGSGRFRLGPVDAIDHEIALSCPGFLGAHYGASPGSPVELVLQRASRVEGQIIDPDGRPVAEARVEAIEMATEADLWPPAHVFETSGPDGRFALEVEEGTYQLQASLTGYTSARTTLRAPASDLVLRLGPGAAVEGLVLDEAGRPVPEVSVTLREPAGGDRRYDPPVAVTDASGRFRIDSVGAGRYRASATVDLRTAPDLPAAWRRTSAELEVPAGGLVSVELRFTPVRSLAGWVVDESGAPVPGARVRALRLDDPKSGPAPEALRGDALTDEGGRFSIPALDSGPRRVEVFKEHGWGTATATAEAGRDDLRLVLSRLHRARGRVVDPEGAPIRYYHLLHDEVEAADGALDVAIPEDGQLALRIAAEGYVPFARQFDLDPSTDAALGELRLQRPMQHVRRVDGLVLDESYRPIARARVRATEPGNAIWVEDASTGADGRFTLQQVGDGAMLHVVHLGHAATRAEVGPAQASVTVVLGRGATLEVRVRSANGAAAPGVRVQLLGGDRADVLFDPREAVSSIVIPDARWAAEALRITTANVAGVARFSGLTAGRYEVGLGSGPVPGPTVTSVEVPEDGHVVIDVQVPRPGATGR